MSRKKHLPQQPAGPLPNLWELVEITLHAAQDGQSVLDKTEETTMRRLIGTLKRNGVRSVTQLRTLLEGF